MNTLKLSPISLLVATLDAALLASLLLLDGTPSLDSGEYSNYHQIITLMLTISSSPNFPVLLDVLMGV
jgi:hypothetical protein